MKKNVCAYQNPFFAPCNSKNSQEGVFSSVTSIPLVIGKITVLCQLVCSVPVSLIHTEYLLRNIFI